MGFHLSLPRLSLLTPGYFQEPFLPRVIHSPQAVTQPLPGMFCSDEFGVKGSRARIPELPGSFLPSQTSSRRPRPPRTRSKRTKTQQIPSDSAQITDKPLNSVLPNLPPTIRASHSTSLPAWEATRARGGSKVRAAGEASPFPAVGSSGLETSQKSGAISGRHYPSSRG